jgi:hypothetical protein
VVNLIATYCGAILGEELQLGVESVGLLRKLRHCPPAETGTRYADGVCWSRTNWPVVEAEDRLTSEDAVAGLTVLAGLGSFESLVDPD